MSSSLNTSGSRDHSYIKMSSFEKIALRTQIVYFTASRYWYRWSKYITFKNSIVLLILFLGYFYMTGAVSSTTSHVVHYIQTKLKPDDILEAHSTIWRLRLEQEKYAQTLKSVQEYMYKMSEQLESLKAAFKELNGTTLIQLTKDGIKYESFAQMEADIKNLELRFEKAQNDIAEAMGIKEGVCTDSPPVFTKPVLHNLASRQNGARVIPELSSPPIVENSFYHKIYNFFFDRNTLQWPITDRTVMLSGDAYCFEGDNGMLTIDLSAAAKVSKIVYEHFYWSNKVPLSSPMKYTVQACFDSHCNGTEFLGECLYMVQHDIIAQECDLLEPSYEVRRIQLHFLANHGQNSMLKGKGSDASSEEETLFQRFSNAENIITDIEMGRFSIRELQPRIKETVTIFEDITRVVSQLGLFSSNESVDELPTSTLPYFMLPCYLGVLHHNRIADIDIKPEFLTLARVYYQNFLSRANEYGIVSMALSWETEEEGEESLPKRDPSLRRTGRLEGKPVPSVIDLRGSKIERFRIQQGFQDAMAKAKKRYLKNNDDDEALRELYIARIRYWCYKLLDELQSIEEELPILEMMIKKRGAEADGQDPLDEKIEPTAPLKPFIIARTEQQKKVLGLGYPSVPTMTVDEWYQRSFGNNTPGTSANQASTLHHAQGDRDDSENDDGDVDNEAKRISQMKMDEYKDTHRRGWGNTHNKG